MPIRCGIGELFLLFWCEQASHRHEHRGTFLVWAGLCAFHHIWEQLKCTDVQFPIRFNWHVLYTLLLYGNDALSPPSGISVYQSLHSNNFLDSKPEGDVSMWSLRVFLMSLWVSPHVPKTLSVGYDTLFMLVNKGICQMNKCNVNWQLASKPSGMLFFISVISFSWELYLILKSSNKENTNT